jgi:hypothetical protein
MDAVLLAEARPQIARAILVLESTFPQSLIPLRNLLGIDVVDGVKPQTSDSELNTVRSAQRVKKIELVSLV